MTSMSLGIHWTWKCSELVQKTIFIITMINTLDGKKGGNRMNENKKTPQDVRNQGEQGDNIPKLTATIILDKELWEEKKNHINSLTSELRKELDTIPEVFKIKC